jgi:hypothetical protein
MEKDGGNRRAWSKSICLMLLFGWEEKGLGGFVYRSSHWCPLPIRKKAHAFVSFSRRFSRRENLKTMLAR